MALTTLANVRLVPGLGDVSQYSDAWLTQLVGAADKCVKRWCKRHLELQARVEYYDGNLQTELVLWERPVLSGTTTVTDNGVVLPTSTINVVSTTGFDPAGRTDLPTISIQTGLTTYTTVTYTGVTSTSFTGCSGGSGTLTSQAGQCAVAQPVVFYDPNGYGNQAPAGVQPFSPGQGPYAPGTMLVQGVNFMTVLDTGGTVSHRGLLRRIGGSGANGFPGWNWSASGGAYGGAGKLSARRQPIWDRGQLAYKLCYSSGYDPIPDDLTFATTSLAAAMIRNQPSGGFLTNESLGAYSYAVLTGDQGDAQEMGTLRQILSRFRECSW